MRQYKLTLRGAVLIACSLVFSNCKKDTATVCKNMSTLGTYDSTALLGEWNFVSFANTLNGKKIKGKVSIEKGHITISDSGRAWLYHTNEMIYSYNHKDLNNISFTLGISTLEVSPQEEKSVSSAMENAYCYIINGAELWIYYKQEDNKNMLILQKKMSRTNAQHLYYV